MDDKVDTPVSLYAATKKSDELFAYCYSKLYNIPTTGLRFFTVYGPIGRPDMAYFEITDKLLNGITLNLFKRGECKRDFTYIDDIVEGIIKVIQGAPKDDVPYAIYNIGNSDPVDLLDFVQTLQDELVRVELLPKDFNYLDHTEIVEIKPGDVHFTYADVSALEKDYGFKPHTSLKDGLRRFVEWYKEYYKK